MDEILNGLSKSDIEVLDFVWESFLRNGESRTEQVFRKRLKDQIGKDSLESSLANLEDAFLFKTQNGSHDKSYQLTLEGCCVVERRTGDFVRVLCVYLDHVKRVYNEKPDTINIKSTELSYTLSNEELSKLIAYIHLGNLWGRSASGLTSSFKNPDQGWEVGIMSNIEELDDAPDSQSFLKSLMLRNIERAKKDKLQKNFSMSYQVPTQFMNQIYSIGGVEYVSKSRLLQFSQIHGEFDFKKLCKLLDELNFNYRAGNFFSCGFILRAIIDHVPPAFGYETFTMVVNNYGTKSFKDSVRRLDESLRKITDSFLHTKIRRCENLPEEQQVHFQAELDSLLGEIVRLCEERQHLSESLMENL